MEIAVRYYSKTGNTKKLADAVANTAGVEAQTVSHPLKHNVDLLFLCDSVYWAGVASPVKKFLKNPGAKIGKLINVSTAALLSSTYPEIKRIASSAGIPVDKREFHCRGQFSLEHHGILHRGHPTPEEITQVKQFTSSIIIRDFN
ncbi:flavodoxin family protein [Lactobacillus ultunensis]|uniref:flavodoxin family protein n=1 Tax=Lactobacillus ultunensis TaxID=227945 RepID=UPI00191169A3|nr:flavodoxin family protein [Lactobacillus ultunensis]QQP28588.1 flavodoxin family protein [Lactobacillus ultunensis]